VNALRGTPFVISVSRVNSASRSTFTAAVVLAIVYYCCVCIGDRAASCAPVKLLKLLAANLTHVECASGDFAFLVADLRVLDPKLCVSEVSILAGVLLIGSG